MRFEDIKAAVKQDLVKEAGDREKLYLRLEHENNMNRMARAIGYTGLGGGLGVAAGSLVKKPGARIGLASIGALSGATISDIHNRAERVAELRQLLRMKDMESQTH